jgi:hypothetical protein
MRAVLQVLATNDKLLQQILVLFVLFYFCFLNSPVIPQAFMFCSLFLIYTGYTGVHR